MPLVEAVTIEVGAAIAKSILKLWVRDSKLGEDISSSLIDLLKAKTSDIFAQRKGERQFADIGDEIGKMLLPLFEKEGTRLDEGDRTAVAIAVAVAFNKSRLSSELLLERNLEPTKLAQYILAAHPKATQNFSIVATDLYERIIKESCIYIVSIASRLPSFTESTFAQVLKREDQIFAKTKEILEELHKIREQLDPTVEAERFEIDYRGTVARKLDILQLFGADVSTVSRRQSLSVAYINLSVEHKSTSLSEPHIAADRVLANSRCFLIRGPAGSGKTTLLQWIAVKSATKSFKGYLSDWNDILPFYIRLRQCVQSGALYLPRPESFPGLITPAIADTMPKGWVHTILRSKHAIILVDGLDEVPASQREDVQVWLKDLVDTYPQARFVVTSRPHAAEEGWIEGFEDATLQPMELFNIYTFIDHWHKAVREELHEEGEKAELESRADHLKTEVRRNRSLRTLATSPLLCAMLCALNRDRMGKLPTDRIELYEACCYLLLERREKERRIELTNDYPQLNYRQKRLLLENLAYWMIKKSISEAPQQDIDEHFAHSLINMQGVLATSGSDVRRLLVERTGVIREPTTGQIDFTHRTFQEFFAAQAALDAMEIKVLIANAHNDQWREVVVLSSGLMNKQMREELITGLIDRGDREHGHRYQLHLLAVSCLEISLQLAPEVKAEVEKRLSTLIPPKDMEDVTALAAAGDLAVKYLINKQEYSSSTAAVCIHTLARIGTDMALDILEEYADDMHQPVVNELLRAWDAFDREAYASRVLSRRTYLHFENLISLEGAQYLASLNTLTLSNCSQLRGLEHLKPLTQLTSLTLSNCSRFSLLGLADLTQLTSLSLVGNTQLRSLSPLASLVQLRSLNLARCTQINDLSPLASLKQLLSLSLRECSQVSDLSPLASLAQLRSLNLAHCLRVSSLNALVGLNNFEVLILSHEIRGKVIIPKSLEKKVRFV